MIFPDKYKQNKKYPKKLFLENKDIDSKARTSIKKHLVSAELSHQISGEEIPSVDNEEYKYKVIQYLVVELDDIKYTKEMGEIFQRAFKSPLIIKFFDNNGYFTYSLAIKRLNKLNNNETVLDEILITNRYDNVINMDIVNIYTDNLNFDNLLNKSNKQSLYYEIYLKVYIIENRKNFNNYKNLLESKIYYDLRNMIKIHKAIDNIIDIDINIRKSPTISSKIELNNKRKEYLKLINEIMQ